MNFPAHLDDNVVFTIRVKKDGTIRRFFDTHHSIERHLQRYGDEISSEFRAEFNKVLLAAANKILPNYPDGVDKEFGIHSRSTEIGVVLGFRPERPPYKKDDLNHFSIMTILPRKSSHFFYDVAASYTVEKAMQADVDRLILEGNLKGGPNECDFYIKEDGAYVITFEGKVWEHNLIIIEVD